MPKVMRQTFRKLWCLLACKKSTSSLISFLRYCKDIANLAFWEFWECLTILFKIILSICSKLSCLSVCKKINFITQFFLKILQRNSKLAILGNFGMPNFICRWKIKFILHVFLEILQRYCKLIALGTLGMPGYANPKLFYQLVENLRVYLQAKNQPPKLFWRYCKDM